MGTPEFAVLSLDAIVKAGHDVAAVVTVPDRQAGRGLKVVYSPVKEYAVQHSLPLLQPERLRDEAFLDALRQLNVDVFVVVAFRMLPACVWQMPPLGTFNLHASLLPQYRGAAPINWAIINGEQQTGVTTFLLNEHIDEGSILLQETTPINENDTLETLYDRLANMGAMLTVKTLDGLEHGTITPHMQNITVPLMPAPKIFKADCAIPWHKGGRAIFNFVRGLSPYPAATTVFIDEKGAQRSAKIFEVMFEPADNVEVGTIVSDGKNDLKIGVIDGFIHILWLQMSGKQKIFVTEFLKGYRVNNWKLDM